jgi:hypothetical protein
LLFYIQYVIGNLNWIAVCASKIKVKIIKKRNRSHLVDGGHGVDVAEGGERGLRGELREVGVDEAAVHAEKSEKQFIGFPSCLFKNARWFLTNKNLESEFAPRHPGLPFKKVQHVCDV